jgi:hypothetical protein
VRTSARWSISAIALLSVAACGRSRAVAPIANAGEAAPLPPAPTGIHPGEQLTYSVMAAGVEVGDVAVATGEPGQVDGSRAVIVLTRGSATGLLSMVKYMRADGESTVALDDGRPISLHGDVDWGGTHFRTVGTFDGPHSDTDWFQGASLVEHVSLTASEGTIHGAVSAAAAVRAWNGAPGDVVRLDVAGAFRLWRAVLRWEGDDTIHSARGVDPAVRISGEAELGGGLAVTFTLWLTDDSDRVPLRLEVHSKLVTATFELTSYSLFAATDAASGGSRVMPL